MPLPYVLVMDPDLEGSDMLALAADRFTFTVQPVRDLDDLVSALSRGVGNVLIIDVDRLAPANVPMLRWLRNLRPGLLVVPTSASGVLALEARVRQQGVFYFLTKPVEREELLLVLHDARHALSAGTPLVPRPGRRTASAGLTVEGMEETHGHD